MRLSLGPSPATGLSFTAKKVTVTVTGALKGTLHATTFTLKGPVGVAVGTATPVLGTMKANKHGMAACATASTGSIGFRVRLVRRHDDHVRDDRVQPEGLLTTTS
ncbi:MAG: hypothetical protein ACYCU7_00100 [Acidimicrobiales bacterium]